MGNGVTYINHDAARSARLAELLADEEFLDEVCGRRHPLREHRDCRQPQPGRTRP